MNTVKQQLQWAVECLGHTSSSARLDSEILLAHCLKKDRSYLFSWPDKELTTQQLSCFHDLVARRLQAQPVAYLVGFKEFYSMPLITTPDTLVPRPETEVLVDTVLALLKNNEAANIIELGTGTGAISLAIKKHSPATRVVATDYSAAALKVAQSNAASLKLDIDFVQCDWFEAINAHAKFDVIVSNPPYVAANDPCLKQGDLPAEPWLALSSGESGLEALEVIVNGAITRLKPSGYLVLEHGFEQAAVLSDTLGKCAFEEIRTEKDFNGLERMTMGRKSRNTT